MAIVTVNVSVPTSGDGPVAVVTNLVGAKTVVLSGFFQGTYLLLASHDGSTFVPVLTFDSNGLEEIRQTLAEAYESVRVRTIAGTTPASVVSLSVSGLSVPGANLFATLANLPAGASGPQTVIDTALLFPPTGLEDDLNFICSGGLLGTIIVEGSTNGAGFNQIGSFQAGPQKRTLLGLSQSLEFSPLPTADTVRYVRINIQGQILGPTTITVGGSIGTGSAPPSSTTLAQAYANGAVAADQMLVLNDARGGGFVVDGSGVGFTGQNAFDVKGAAGGDVVFPRAGGLSVVSNLSRAAGPAVVWDESSFLASTLTLTGPPATVSSLAMVRVERGGIQGIGNTVSDAYDLLVNLAPAGTATITRAWSLGAVDAIQAQRGLVLGAGLAPPGESDLVVGPGATALSQASTGRLGYLAGGAQQFVVSTNGGAYVPLLVGPAPGGFTQGSVPFGSATGSLIQDNAGLFWDEANRRLGVDVAASPTARIHVAGVTAAAGTASLKLDPGTLMVVAESGAVESDGVDLWWTTALGARVKLNNSAATLAAVYTAGAAAPDQTMVVLDARGGGIVVNATTPLQTFVTALEVDVIGGSVNFYRVGGFDVASTISRAAAHGTAWNEVAFLSSTLALTGGPTTVTASSMVRIGQGVVNGPGNTVSDAYDLLVEAAPAGTATFTRSWSAGFAGALQAQTGLVLGSASLPPTESDLVVEAGATVVSQANTGRLGYLTGLVQQFMVSANGGAYVPLLVGPAPGGFTPGSVPFGSATGSLVQDNAALFWDDTGKFLGVGTSGPAARLTVAGGSYADVAGARDNVLATASFAPVGGTAAFNQLDLQYTVDQTGGASGRIVGLLIAATETAVGGLHYPIDVFAGAGGVTEIFRLTSTGTVQTKQGLTLGLGLSSPGESDLAMEAGATNLSQANTGRIGYRTSTQQFYASMNGGAYVPIATGATSVTLAQAYGFGTVAADQTLALLDAKGGGLVVDGTAVGFTGTNALAVNGAATGFVLFPRVGGMSVVSSISVAAAPGSVWDEISLLGSTLTLTGGPATSTKVAQIHIGQGTINGFGNTVTDSYDFFVDAAPTGTATLTRLWSAGFVSAVQAQAGLVLGAGLAPPGESDLVVGAGATSVSAANTGRLGYLAGGTQKFVVSQNGGAYVALLTSVTLAQAYAFGTVAADQTFTLLDAKGGGLVVDGTAVGFTGTNALAVNGTASSTVLFPRLGGLTVKQGIVNTGVPTALTVTGGAHTAITLSTEDVGANFNFSATKQWATGALATQREVLIQAPTYAFTSAATITTAATLAITGAPITGANATITNSLALWIQSGASQFDGITKHSNGTSTAPSITWTTDTTNGLYHTGTGATGAILSTINGVQKTVVSANGFGIGVTSATTILDILQAQNSATIFQHRNTNSGSNAQVAWKLSNDAVNILQIGKVSSNFTGSPTVDINAGYVESIGGPLYLRTTGTDFISFAANDADFMRLQPTGNLILGGSLTDLITSKLVVDGSIAITATTGATWNGINFVSPTVIISGATTPITTLNSFVIGGPTVSSVSAVDITDFFVCRIGSASLAGLASITRNWCLGIDGNTKFGGGQTIKGTDVNVAGPYVIHDTDYALEVRRTATAAISINLPSIAIVGNGRIVISIDSGYNAAVNNITLVRNGTDKINNVSGNYTQNVTGSAIWLKANTTTSNWEIV